MALFTINFPDAVLPAATAVAIASLEARGIEHVDQMQPYEAVGMMLALYLADVTVQKARNDAQTSVQTTLTQAETAAQALAAGFSQLTITPVPGEPTP